MIKEAFYIITDTFEFKIHIKLTLFVTLLGIATILDRILEHNSGLPCQSTYYEVIYRN